MANSIAQFEIKQDRDISMAAHRARLLASLAGLSTRQRTGFGRAVHEVTHEALHLAGTATLEFRISEEESRQLLEAVIRYRRSEAVGASPAPGEKQGESPAISRARDSVEHCAVVTRPQRGTVVRLAQPLPAPIPLNQNVLADWASVLTSKSTANALIASHQRVLELDRELTAAQQEGIRLQQELHELRSSSDSQSLLSLVARKTDSAVIVLDADQIVQWVNDAFLRMTRYESSEIVGRRPYEVFYGPETDGIAVREIDEALRAGHGAVREVLHYGRDGRTFWASCNYTPVLDERGRLTYCIGILTDITKRRQAQEVLERAKEAAETASRAKSEFLANMSHEIRTPMNAIIGMTELSLCTELTEDQREYLTLVKESAESLLRLLNDVLDLSKIEAGKIEIDATEFNLADVLRETMKALSVRASQKALELAWYMPPTVPEHVVGDPARLRQVLINLVDNAVKFTSHGEVVVHVKPEWQTETEVALRFSVADTGIGIPAERLANIFEAFRQADSSTSRQYGGTGLGLTISSQLIELMGGQIWVKSEPGKGSTFFFSIRFGAQTEPLPSPAEIQNHRLAGKTVLIVDDNATNRRILKEYVQTWGMQPTVVDGGQTALAELAKAAARNRRFDLVISDSLMPGMDGFELARHIKDDSGKAVSSVMMLSSADHPGDVSRCRELGVVAYLTKPIAPAELREAVLRALGHDEEAAPQVRSASPASLPHLLRVLVADDNTANRVLAARIIEERGHHVVSVGSGREAIDSLEEERFDVILMDVQMPGMDGFAATKAIRRKEEQTGQHAPIIAMTAYAMKGDRERCLAAGMDAYIAKPIRAAELETLVESLGNAATIAEMPKPRAVETPGQFDFSLALRRLKGNLELLKEQMGFFLSDAPDLLREAGATIADANPQALEFAAHRLKGLVGNFDAKQAEECAQRLEWMGRDGDLAEAEETFEQLRVHVAALQQALGQFLAGR
jgi:PAS domain S-box-containing protein